MLRSLTRLKQSSSTSLQSSFTTLTNSSTTTASQSLPPKEARSFIDFINASPSPFHVVHESVQRLEAAGFQRLNERSDWQLKRKGKYYFTRNGSSVVAFVVGGQYKTGNGFTLVGAHTDSPCLKVKTLSKIKILHLFVMLIVLYFSFYMLLLLGQACLKERKGWFFGSGCSTLRWWDLVSHSCCCCCIYDDSKDVG